MKLCICIFWLVIFFVWEIWWKTFEETVWFSTFKDKISLINYYANILALHEVPEIEYKQKSCSQKRSIAMKNDFNTETKHRIYHTIKPADTCRIENILKLLQGKIDNTPSTIDTKYNFSFFVHFPKWIIKIQKRQLPLFIFPLQLLRGKLKAQK